MDYPRIVFMGTPEFSATILQGLIDNNYNVIGLVSQPDRPVGRKKVIMPTPTKEVALKYNIPVFQPEKIRKDYDFMKELNPDLIVTCFCKHSSSVHFINHFHDCNTCFFVTVNN